MCASYWSDASPSVYRRGQVTTVTPELADATAAAAVALCSSSLRLGDRRSDDDDDDVN